MSYHVQKVIEDMQAALKDALAWQDYYAIQTKKNEEKIINLKEAIAELESIIE